MAKTFVKPVIFFTIVLALALGFSSALTIPVRDEHNADVTTYIVHLEKPAELDLEVSDDHFLTSWYTSFLTTSLQTMSSDDQELIKNRIVHSYRNVFTGFAVKLTGAEAETLTLVNGVVSVREAQEYSLHTTHTPSFLGLRRNQLGGLWKDANLGKGVIIGILDTGIYPDHPSFSDEGMPPPPAKWKGRCDFNGTLCNNKLIGAMNFAKDRDPSNPSIDYMGHGTHTSSTAAGNFADGANELGQANGTAAGMAPLAHIAMYRVCVLACMDSDILAGMDAAIGDGVDVLSLSLGSSSVKSAKPFHHDTIAIGAFRAIQRGIFVSCSAGNSGPNYNTVENEAPWYLSVGASTVDRTLKATARLGNGAEYDGESIFQPAGFNSSQLLPLVYPGSNGDPYAAICSAGSLRNAGVEGKVVMCLNNFGGQEVKDAGGAAMIVMNDQLYGFSTELEVQVVPTTTVSYAAGLEILAYINWTSNPTATIVFKGTVIGDPTAPAIPWFSSRGPSRASPGILKPDIIGPGVNILAAWPPVVVEDNFTPTKPRFHIISGTSMSCPHLSGIAALLKSSHPDWSPAALKSAIMTSADTINLGNKPIIDDHSGLAADIFAIGSGHVNPSRAQNPGLIYDLSLEDYIPYLCGLGYSDNNIMAIVQTKVRCSEVSAIPEAQLNYPSFSIILGSSPQNYTRTVTNVGPVNSTYTYKLDAPEGVDITVTPAELQFSKTTRTAMYSVTFSESASGSGGKQFSQGALTWSSGQFSVRSPIAVKFS